jgi:serine/threonine protein kinase
MSPEQISGMEGIDARSDLYSLACVLFECLAGRPPYEDPYEDRVLTKHQTAEIPDLRTLCPEAPPALAAVIRKAMAKAPEDRWASAEQMAGALPVLTPA